MGPVNADALTALLFAILGLLVGSFSNVLIWRLPRGENIAFPPSHCPRCDHPLRPLDLVPVLSWAALGGKCRYCRAPINPRYPLVELLTGLGYGLIALAFPLSVYGVGTAGLMVLFTLLLVGSAIDLDTYTIPDELTLPGTALGLLFALGGAGLAARPGGLGLPNPSEALLGALLGAGLLVSINLFGTWVMRRFRERSYPDFPIGYQQISLGLLAGAWLGPAWGLGLGLVSAGVNRAARRIVPIPEALTLGGFLLSLGLAGTLGADPLTLLRGGLSGAGAVALACGVYWWLYWRRQPKTGASGTEADGASVQESDDAPADAVAMGFGDVKLAAVIGAFLGWERLVLAVAVAVFAGALFGVLQLALKRENRIKFGPYLALGAVVALFWGGPLIQGYRLGLGH